MLTTLSNLMRGLQYLLSEPSERLNEERMRMYLHAGVPL